MNAYRSRHIADPQWFTGNLYHQVRLLIENPVERQRLGENGYKLLMQNRGATERTLAVIDRHLGR